MSIFILVSVLLKKKNFNIYFLWVSENIFFINRYFIKFLKLTWSKREKIYIKIKILETKKRALSYLATLFYLDVKYS